MSILSMINSVIRSTERSFKIAKQRIDPMKFGALHCEPASACNMTFMVTQYSDRGCYPSESINKNIYAHT